MNNREPWLVFVVRRFLLDFVRNCRSIRHQFLYDLAVLLGGFRQGCQAIHSATLMVVFDALRTISLTISVHFHRTALWHVSGFFRQIINDVLLVSFGVFGRLTFRSAGRVVLSLPAASAITLIMVLFLWPSDVESTIKEFDQAALSASATGNSRLTRLYRERLASLEPTSKREYELALAIEKTDDLARCKGLMLRLAPEAKIGYGPAHCWLARQLLSSSSLTAKQLAEAWVHLERALHFNPADNEANQLFAKLLLVRGDLQAAEPHLHRVAEMAPEVRLILAKIHFRQGKFADARREAAELCSSIHAAVSTPADCDPKLVLTYACGQALLGNFEQAIDLASRVRPQDEVARQILSNLHVDWWDASYPKELSLLKRALEIDPGNVAAVSRVIKSRSASGPDGAAANRLLERLVADGSKPPMVQFALGNHFWAIGRQEIARTQLEHAHHQLPGSLEIANNLAFMIAHSEPRDLRQALELVSQAIARAPRPLSVATMASLYDTRGDILRQLGNWKSAAEDLELALFCDPTNATARRGLEQCYQRIGRPPEPSSPVSATQPAGQDSQADDLD